MDSDLRISTGIDGLDQTLDFLRRGDTVTWQIENVGDYVFAVTQRVNIFARTGHRIVFLRFVQPRSSRLEPENSLVLNVGLACLVH